MIINYFNGHFLLTRWVSMLRVELSAARNLASFCFVRCGLSYRHLRLNRLPLSRCLATSAPF